MIKVAGTVISIRLLGYSGFNSDFSSWVKSREEMRTPAILITARGSSDGQGSVSSKWGVQADEFVR
jgi:hypothetical protein